MPENVLCATDVSRECYYVRFATLRSKLIIVLSNQAFFPVFRPLVLDGCAIALLLLLAVGAA